MVALNTEQRFALKMALDGHNFIVLGSAGTGKSTVVSAIVEHLRSHGKKVALSCSTGIACLVYDQRLEATTIHRFAGIEDGRHDPKEIGPWIMNSPKHSDVLKRITETDVLIIDECSMISARTLESISEVLALKDPSQMFGGIQVILCGDFRQLPPVKDTGYGDDGAYCFEAKFFSSVFPHRVVLNEIVRQCDKRLITTIQEVSKGTPSEDTINFINSLNIELPSYDINLFSKNEIVDDFNRKNILDFPGELFEFCATDDGEDKKRLDRLTVPKKLWLKIGIPVILLRNLTDRLVNGLRGEVYDIDEDGPTIEFQHVGITTRITKCSFEVFSPRLRRNVAVRTQFPIKPAFGLTIHKAQGMTLDRVHIDCNEIFQAGQLGVAISRVKTAEGLYVTNFHPKCCIGHPLKVAEFIEEDTVHPLEDKSCCRNCRRNEIQTADDLSDTLFIPADADLGSDEEDENEFDNEFDQVIQAIDSDSREILDFSLPNDFLCQSVLDSIKVLNPITPSQMNTNSILSNLPIVRIECFCKKEFLVVSKILEELNISEPREVQSKELTMFYTKIHTHLSSVEYTMNCLSVFDYSDEAFTDDHKHICFNVHQAVRKYLLKQKTNLYQHENQSIRKRFLTTPSKARLRYVGGYCVAKLKHNYAKKKSTHRYSLSSESRCIYEECDDALAILNCMKEEEEHLKASTTEEATLSDICRRQNLSRSLTHITDGFFEFFTKLCEMCLELLVVENLNKYGEEMFSFCLTELSTNKNMESEFSEKISAKINDCQTGAVIKLSKNEELKNRCINKIYQEIVKKFLMVLFAQFRKDLKSSFHVEKTMAHRKQIQISKQKKEKAKAADSATAEPGTSSSKDIPDKIKHSKRGKTPKAKAAGSGTAEPGTSSSKDAGIATIEPDTSSSEDIPDKIKHSKRGKTSKAKATGSGTAEASTSSSKDAGIATVEHEASSSKVIPDKTKRSKRSKASKSKGKTTAAKPSGSYVK